MRKIIALFKKKCHVHYFAKPVISRYVSFNHRDVIYECRCGKRDVKRVHHDLVYPFPTANLLNYKEFLSYLENGKYPYIYQINKDDYACISCMTNDGNPL